MKTSLRFTVCIILFAILSIRYILGMMINFSPLITFSATALGILVYFLFLLTLYQTLHAIPAEKQQQPRWFIWLMLIPGISVFFQWLILSRGIPKTFENISKVTPKKALKRLSATGLLYAIFNLVNLTVILFTIWWPNISTALELAFIRLFNLNLLTFGWFMVFMNIAKTMLALGSYIIMFIYWNMVLKFKKDVN